MSTDLFSFFQTRTKEKKLVLMHDGCYFDLAIAGEMVVSTTSISEYFVMMKYIYFFFLRLSTITVVTIIIASSNTAPIEIPTSGATLRFSSSVVVSPTPAVDSTELLLDNMVVLEELSSTTPPSSPVVDWLVDVGVVSTSKLSTKTKMKTSSGIFFYFSHAVHIVDIVGVTGVWTLEHCINTFSALVYLNK